MESDLLILVGTVLVNNIALTLNLGLCALMGGSKKLELSVARRPINALVLTMRCGATRIHYFPQARISIYGCRSDEPGVYGIARLTN